MCDHCGHTESSHLIAWPVKALCLVNRCSCGSINTDIATFVAFAISLAYLTAHLISWASAGFEVIR